jgi:hypothetical protein
MTDLEKEITHLQELQAKHRQNTRILEEMLANYGMDRPLPLLNNLEFEREQLRQVEKELAAALATQAEMEGASTAPIEPGAAPPTGQVTVTNSGAAAGGKGTAAGAGGVAVGGDVHGGIHVSAQRAHDEEEK